MDFGRTTLSALFFFIVTAIASSAQSLTTLVDFDNSNGANPEGALVQGIDGKFYGVTATGGMNGDGTVFVTTAGGILTTLHNFGSVDGSEPSELVLATNGTFYGLASFGTGLTESSIFKITTNGKFTPLDTFISSAAFNNSMLQSASGNFYGTTFGGGTSGMGSVFKMTPTGTLTTLYSFCTQFNCPDGAAPSGLVQGINGNFYGTTTGSNSNTNSVGSVFRITPSGNLTTLYTFCNQGQLCTDGEWPDGLVQASDGSFYGTTIWGGATGIQCQPNGPPGCGTIYKITPSGTLTTLYTFCTQGPPCADGGLPLGHLVQGTDGNFYGITFTGTNCTFPGPCGTIFRMTPSGALTTLHVFDYTDGSQPRDLTQATDGNFYGMTVWGGAYGWGTIFRLSTGLGPFVKFVQRAGRIGQAAGIIGQGLKGASSVSFNGTSASFTIVSDNLIKATVPPGATSGFVTIQTPTRTLKSNTFFYVF